MFYIKAKLRELMTTKKGKHDALQIADYLIRKGIENDNALTPLQVIKLVYFCQAWMLGLYGKPLYKQNVEAWIYGPVIVEVYHELKGHRNNPILCDMGTPNPNLDEYEEDVISQVYENYGDFSGIELSHITHAPNTPWDIVWNNREGKKSWFGIRENKIISNKLMKTYYANQVKN